MGKIKRQEKKETLGYLDADDLLGRTGSESLGTVIQRLNAIKNCDSDFFLNLDGYDSDLVSSIKKAKDKYKDEAIDILVEYGPDYPEDGGFMVVLRRFETTKEVKKRLERRKEAKRKKGKEKREKEEKERKEFERLKKKFGV